MQEEDGIRDLGGSRGLGDVYRGQGPWGPEAWWDGSLNLRRPRSVAQRLGWQCSGRAAAVCPTVAGVVSKTQVVQPGRSSLPNTQLRIVWGQCWGDGEGTRHEFAFVSGKGSWPCLRISASDSDCRPWPQTARAVRGCLLGSRARPENNIAVNAAAFATNSVSLNT